jgi:hypothetical protein
VWVDLERPLGLRPPGGELVALQVGLAERDQDLGRLWVDLLGPGQLAVRRGLVVAREEQPAFKPGGLPAMRIGPERPLIDLVDHVVERFAQLVAAGQGTIIALGGLADDQKPLGSLADVARAVVVPIDEPLPGEHGLIDLAACFQEPRLDPAGEQVVGVGLLRLLDRGVGAVPVAARELQLGQASGGVGVVGLFAGERPQALDRPLQLALAGQAVRPAQDGLRPDGGGEALSFQDRVVRLLGLGVPAVLPEPARLVEPGGLGGQRHDHSPEDRAEHAHLPFPVTLT